MFKVKVKKNSLCHQQTLCWGYDFLNISATLSGSLTQNLILRSISVSHSTTHTFELPRSLSWMWILKKKNNKNWMFSNVVKDNITWLIFKKGCQPEKQEYFLDRSHNFSDAVAVVASHCLRILQWLRALPLWLCDKVFPRPTNINSNLSMFGKY